MEPPHSIAQARVDDKGRLKLPSEFLEYLKKLGVDKVFITTFGYGGSSNLPHSECGKATKIFSATRANWRSLRKTWLTSPRCSAEIRRSMRRGGC